MLDCLILDPAERPYPKPSSKYLHIEDPAGNESTLTTSMKTTFKYYNYVFPTLEYIELFDSNGPN